MKITFSTILLILITVSLFAQNDTIQKKETPKDTAWTFEGQSSFNFTQGYLENWVEGGDNFLSSLLLNDYTLSYDRNHTSWENIVKYKLGGTQQGEEDLRKTEDIFEFTSKLGYDISKKNFFFSNIINFQTQFFKGHDYANDNDSIPVSRFLNPAKLTIATGFEYKYKKMLSAMVSPLSGKLTFMTDTENFCPETYGIDAGNKYKAEMGAYIKIAFKKDVIKNININSTLVLFNNYFREPENIDINWQTTITFTVNEYINAVLYTNFIYDDDIKFEQPDGTEGPRWQIKETLGIGLAYKINSKKKE